MTGRETERVQGELRPEGSSVADHCRDPESPRGSGLVLFTLWLMVFTAASQIMIIAPIIPRISEELGVEASALGLLMTVYALAVGVVALVTGPISDRYGRRRILLIGTGLMTVALLLHGVAESYGMLLTVRALAGGAGGILSGGAVSYVGDYFPIERRGWASGWVMSGLAAGQIAGIPLGTMLAEWFGYQAPFLAFAVVGALAFALILARLPQPQIELPRKLSLGSALEGYRTLLRRREVRAAGAAFVLMFMGISLYVTFFPTWLESALGFTPAMVSILYLVGGTANVLVGPRAGDLSDRIGRTRVIIVSSIGVAIVMPIVTLVPASLSWIVYPLFFLVMALVAARMSPMQALMTQLTDGRQRGTLMSLVTSIGQIGFAIGSALAAVTIEVFGFTGDAIFAALSVVGMAWVVHRFLRGFDIGSENLTSGGTPAGSSAGPLAVRGGG